MLRPTLSFFFFFNDTATTEIYTLSLHDALPIYRHRVPRAAHRDLLRGRQPAPRARVEAVRDRQASRRQGVDPWRARIEDQFHRAPRADRPAHRPLREARRTRERHRRKRLRL